VFYKNHVEFRFRVLAKKKKKKEKFDKFREILRFSDFVTSGGGIVGARLCFLLIMLILLLGIFFFFRQHNNALHIREQQPLEGKETKIATN
jgi:preprotein translocase subunit YajC